MFLTLLLSATGCSNGTSAAGTGGGRGGRGRGGDGVVPIVAAKVVQKDVPVDLSAIGNVEAYSTISVRAQVAGQLIDVSLNEGDFVKKGDHLFTIDPRPYEAQLAQAEANLKRDEALLTQAQSVFERDASNAEYQQLVADRQKQLSGRGIVSRDQVEQARAAADAAAAAVKADRAAIESARAQFVAQQAAVQSARVALGYTVIHAPLDGRTGNLAVKAGNLVTANTTELTTIAQIQPIYVTFNVPAMHLPIIKRHLTQDPLTATATPQDADSRPVIGRLTFADNTVDASTDTIKLKATFDNADRRLWPGQFARVNLRIAMLSQATVVSSQAVQTGQDGQFVFIVKPDSTVEQRPVVTGQRIGDDLVVEKGLQPGDTIVTEGQLRLEAGSRVQVGSPGAEGGGRRVAGRTDESV